MPSSTTFASAIASLHTGSTFDETYGIFARRYKYVRSAAIAKSTTPPWGRWVVEFAQTWEGSRWNRLAISECLKVHGKEELLRRFGKQREDNLGAMYLPPIGFLDAAWLAFNVQHYFHASVQFTNGRVRNVDTGAMVLDWWFLRGCGCPLGSCQDARDLRGLVAGSSRVVHS